MPTARTAPQRAGEDALRAALAEWITDRGARNHAGYSPEKTAALVVAELHGPAIWDMTRADDSPELRRLCEDARDDAAPVPAVTVNPGTGVTLPARPVDPADAARLAQWLEAEGIAGGDTAAEVAGALLEWESLHRDATVLFATGTASQALRDAATGAAEIASMDPDEFVADELAHGHLTDDWKRWAASDRRDHERATGTRGTRRLPVPAMARRVNTRDAA